MTRDLCLGTTTWQVSACKHGRHGYLISVVPLLTPTRVWAAWQYRAPGSSTGLSHDGLVWCDDHWAFFPKLYRVLTSR